MPSQQKRQFVADLTEKLSKSDSLVLAEFNGLTVAALTELRMKLRQIQGELKVIKNRLAIKAIEQRGDGNSDTLKPLFKGSTAAVFGHGDPLATAKVLKDFGKDKENFKIKGALVNGRFMGAPEYMMFASLPSREVLIGQLVGLLASPMRRLVTALSQPHRALVQVLAQIEKQKK